MNSVRLYYVLLGDTDNAVFAVDKPIVHEMIRQWLAELPEKKRASLQRLLAPRDRDVSLIAQRLLKHCVADEGVESFQLKDVYYPPAAKPYWSERNVQFLDFNISHSGRLIMVALSQNLTLGVDVEKHRQLKNLNFKMVLSKHELETIEREPKIFFELWSKKEAVVKAADTTGIARMREVKLGAGLAELDGKNWQIKKINDINCEHEAYSIHLATSEPVTKIIIKQKFLDEL